MLASLFLGLVGFQNWQFVKTDGSERFVLVSGWNAADEQELDGGLALGASGENFIP